MLYILIGFWKMIENFCFARNPEGRKLTPYLLPL